MPRGTTQVHPVLLVLTATSAAAAADEPPDCTYENATDFNGNDVGQAAVTTPGACCEACAATAGCKAWTLWSGVHPKCPTCPDTPKCYLKNSDSGRTVDIYSVSGHQPSAPPTPSPPSAPPTPSPPSAPPTPSPPLPPPPPPATVCTTCRGPRHSWASLPVFFHSADPDGPHGGFTEAALDTIERFPIVTLEKWQGAGVSPPMFQEEAWLNAARQIKCRDPNITVIVWYDSLRIYTSNRTLNPELLGPCTTGHLRTADFLETHPEFLLKNASGQPAFDPWSGCHIWDHTKDFARRRWTQMCLNMTSSGVIDGCGADDSEDSEQWAGPHMNLEPATAAAWGKGHRSMMRATTAALGDGVLLGKFAFELLGHFPESEEGNYVNGALEESCDASNATVTKLRSLAARAEALGRRLVYECHSHNGRKLTPAERESEVAAFLVGAGPSHFYGLGGWFGTGQHGNFSEHWVPGLFDRPLGAPHGAAGYDVAASEWSRTFGAGTVVRFNALTNTGSIAWASVA